MTIKVKGRPSASTFSGKETRLCIYFEKVSVISEIQMYVSSMF